MAEGRHQRPCRVRGRHRQPAAAGQQVRGVVSGHGGAGRDGRIAASAASGRHRVRPGHGIGRGLHPGGGPAARRGGRVLRRAHSGRGVGRRGRGDASGVRRDAVEQAVLLLRGGPLARRRPDPAAPPRAAEVRPQCPLAQLRGVRRDVDARQLGVSVVCGVGLGISLRRAGARRSGVREVPAAAAVPRMVSTPQRGAARIRVGFLRRQPARACLGGAGGVWYRRGPRLRFSQPDFRQAVGQLHLVGESARRQRLQPVRGRVHGAGQHRPLGPIPPSRPRRPQAVRRNRVDGGIRVVDGHDCGDPARVGAATRARFGAEVP